MLISAVLTIAPTGPVTLPANLGRAAHAWFLNQVRAADPAIAQALHEPNQERPFTVSNLQGRNPASGRSRVSDQLVSPERSYALRLTSFWPELSALLLERLLPNLPEQTLDLAGATCRVVSVTTDGTAHPWAGQTSFQDLVQQHTLSPALPPRQVTLHFASPTVFRSGGANVPLPLPGLVFESLVRRWNAFAPLQIPLEIRRFADEAMVIARYHLHTERVAFGEEGERGAYPGFVGTCSYAFLVHDRYWLGLIHLLAAFAFYAGVGARTTMGLGQVRVVHSPQPRVQSP
jgi:CRISPR-associated endoribonuclease Cas6